MGTIAAKHELGRMLKDKPDEWRVVLRINRANELSDPEVAQAVAAYLREKAKEVVRQATPPAEKWAKTIRMRLAAAA